MNRYLLSIFWVVLFCAHAFAQPNVLLVMADDMGIGDVDALFDSDLETPNLDNFWSDSVRLKDFHASPSCSPTRGALLTGRYSNSVGSQGTGKGRNQVYLDETTMAEMFQAGGYRTFMTGKWHLGEAGNYLPENRGFEYVSSYRGSAIGDIDDYWRNDYYSGVDYAGNPNAADTYYRSDPLGTQLVQADRYATDYWFEEAKNYITQSVNDEKPFFGYMPLNAAHFPFNAPFGGKEGFDGLVENIDENMGAMDTFLDGLGAKDDTIVIFMSDNGTAGSRTAGLVGKKGHHKEGGHKVPFFIRWPNASIDGGRDVDAMGAHIDVLPTLAELTGVATPTGKPLHGQSLVGLINETESPTDRTVVIDSQRVQNVEKYRAVSVMHDETDGAGTILHKWRLTRVNASHGWQLFDVQSDPGQSTNLINTFPAVVTQLKDEYDDWWDATRPPADPTVPGYDLLARYQIGHENETRTRLTAHSLHGTSASSQEDVRFGNSFSGFWALEAMESGIYSFELRRWPEEIAGTLGGTPPPGWGSGRALDIAYAVLTIGEDSYMLEVDGSELAAQYFVELAAGPLEIEAEFFNSAMLSIGSAYYVYVEEFILYGDYNGDGVVDGADYTVWQDTLGDSVVAFSGADGDGDGLISTGDFTVWVDNFGNANPPLASGALVASVPEPASWALMLVAMAAQLTISRRKKK